MENNWWGRMAKNSSVTLAPFSSSAPVNTLKTKQLNGIQPSFILLFTHVWMSSAKKTQWTMSNIMDKEFTLWLLLHVQVFIRAYSASGWTTVSTSVMGFLYCWRRARCRSLRSYQMLKDSKQLHIWQTVLRKKKKKLLLIVKKKPWIFKAIIMRGLLLWGT